MPPIKKKNCIGNEEKGFGISALTGKAVRGDNKSGINKEYLLRCNHLPDFDDFSILATNNEFELPLLEVFESSKFTFL